MSILIDSYGESYRTSYAYVDKDGDTSYGQSFMGSGLYLYSAKFYLKQNLGGATGNVYAKLYTHSGTFGTSSVGTGNALATSNPKSIAEITTTWTLYEVLFPVLYELSAVPYVIQCEFTGGDSSHYLMIGFDATTKGHQGNLCYKNHTNAWSYNTNDTCFYVYGTTGATNFVPQIIVS